MRRRRARPSRNRQVWLWVRWLATVVGLVLVARVAMSVVLVPGGPDGFLWGAAVLLGLAATFLLVPMPNEHVWEDESPELPLFER